jgi:hypothetical protein
VALQVEKGEALDRAHLLVLEGPPGVEAGHDLVEGVELGVDVETGGLVPPPTVDLEEVRAGIVHHR